MSRDEAAQLLVGDSGMLSDPRDFHAVRALVCDGPLRHPGDLCLPRPLAGELIVFLGDVTIDGDYFDPPDPPYATIVIRGDLRARHVWTGHDLFVEGDVRAEGLVRGHSFSDGGLRVAGTVNAGAVVMDGHWFFAKSAAELNIDLQDDQEGFVDLEHARRILRPDVFDVRGNLDVERLARALQEKSPILGGRPGPDR